MDWSIVCLILTTLCGVFGGTFLVAECLSLNTIMGETSRADGRSFFEKRLYGSMQDHLEARGEMFRRLPETWAKQPVTRYLIYSGAAFLLLARILSECGGPSLQSPRSQAAAPKTAVHAAGGDAKRF